MRNILRKAVAIGWTTCCVGIEIKPFKPVGHIAQLVPEFADPAGSLMFP
jgi:hypothetical protein